MTISRKSLLFVQTCIGNEVNKDDLVANVVSQTITTDGLNTNFSAKLYLSEERPA